MHTMTRGCLVLEARFDTEPAAWLDGLLPALRPLADAVQPASMFVCSPGGKVSRDRRFKWSTIEGLAGLPTTGTISMNTHEGHGPKTVSAYLRHNLGVDLEFQPPAVVWLGVEGAQNEWQGVLAACCEFLANVASAPGVLHGCITVLDNLTQATCEVTGTASDVEAQPPTFVRRTDHDWRYPRHARTVCRRLYWTMLLGPTLASAAGGAEAARAAGALDVQEINGSLLFRAMAGPPRDSLDPAFLAATTRLRRWLWPHTFQNPLDAAGFEADVGLPVSTES